MHQLLSKVLTKQERTSWKQKIEQGPKPLPEETLEILTRIINKKLDTALQQLTKEDTDPNWEHRTLSARAEYKIFNELNTLLKELL